LAGDLGVVDMKTRGKGKGCNKENVIKPKGRLMGELTSV